MAVEPLSAAGTGRPEPKAAGALVARLFEQHGRMVYALCRLLLRSREDAEDATQQTFLQAHRSIERGTNPEQPAAWLAAIARNECYRQLGRRPPEAAQLLEREAPGLDPASAADQRAEIAALCAALAELPPVQRQAVVLREFYGLSYREIAAALDLSGPAVESVLFKSRKSLQDRLRPLRALSGVATLPLGVRDALAAAIPGFSGGAAGGGVAASATVAAKLGAAPLVAKLAAAALLVGAGTAVTVAATQPGNRAQNRPASVARPQTTAARGPGHDESLTALAAPTDGASALAAERRRFRRPISAERQREQEATGRERESETGEERGDAGDRAPAAEVERERRDAQPRAAGASESAESSEAPGESGEGSSGSATSSGEDDSGAPTSGDTADSGGD